MNGTSTLVVSDSSAIATPASFRYWNRWLPVLLIGWVGCAWTLSDSPTALVNANWPLFLLGVAGAMIGNATAVGGGLIFVPATMFFYHSDALEALRLALCCQAFGMTSGAIAWWKRGFVSPRLALSMLPLLALGCSVGVWVFAPEASLVKALFGPISVLIGLVTLIHRRGQSRSDEIPRSAMLGVAICALVGSLVTSWVAIGVGELLAAYLMVRWRVRAEAGIALGVVCLSACSIMLGANYMLEGSAPWGKVAFMGLGCILGARLGPYLTQRLSEKLIRYTFAAIAISDGALFVIQYGLR